ncbi:MAG: hypothetical protein R3B81_19330 [bacterium]
MTHDWAFVIDGNFLELRTRSTVRTDTGGGEVHEDVAYVSHDRDHDAFVCRQFLSEGYVNTYDIRLPPDPGGEILFAHRDSEGSGGVRAQIRLRFVSRDEYVMALDLAFTPDAEFKACQEMRMHRRP